MFLEHLTMLLPYHDKFVRLKISAADWHWANQWTWQFDGQYAIRQERIKGRNTKFYFHRELLGLDRSDRREVHHLNGDKLDNRRSNLKIYRKRGKHQRLHAKAQWKAGGSLRTAYEDSDTWGRPGIFTQMPVSGEDTISSREFRSEMSPGRLAKLAQGW